MKNTGSSINFAEWINIINSLKKEKNAKRRQVLILALVTALCTLAIPTLGSLSFFSIFIFTPSLITMFNGAMELKELKKKIASLEETVENDMLEAVGDKTKNESLDITQSSIISNRMRSFDQDTGKQVINKGQYILVGGDEDVLVLRQYYDENDCFQVEVVEPELQEDMKMLETDAPKVVEEIKKLTLK